MMPMIPIQSGLLPAENIPDLVARAFEAMPAHTAEEFYSAELTRAELADRSDRLAASLMRHGVGPGSLVGIYLDRSLEMLVAVLGTMKAGAAYVPLDPAFPTARIEQILEDTCVPVILTLTRNLDLLPKTNAKVIALDSQTDTLANEPLATLPAISRDMLAYVIFTSGSTGRPKGVEVTHGSVVNLLVDLAARLDMKPGDRWLAVTTLSFDISVLELLLPLVSGGTVIIARREDAADGARLMDLIRTTGSTVLQATPATWKMLLEQGFQPAHGFKMLCGGEAWTSAIAELLLGAGQSGATLWNMYGPTETTVWSSVTEVRRGAKRVTIGPPIANTRFYILDSGLQLVPQGVSGELFIAGMGVAQGYFQRPELTAVKFLRDPFFPAEKMYRTGDEVRQVADGHIEFLGRLDQQIKLRGYRIELGEIETAMRALPELRDAVAVLRPDAQGDAILVGYYTGAERHSPFDLKNLLANHLPAYMIPTILKRIESLPFTPNGKLDRRALSEIPLSSGEGDAIGELMMPGSHNRQAVLETSSPQDGVSSTAAEQAEILEWTRTERDMLQIWQQIFKIRQVGVDADFFDLGGHSLLLARLQIALKKKFNVQLAAADVFRHSTLRELASWVDRSSQSFRHFPTFENNPRIIPIQPLGRGRPLFVISQSMIFRTLAFEMGLDQPVYALQMLDEDVSPGKNNTTMEQLAQFYLKLIRQVQPTGPYRLVGWCVSGWIAYAVAQLLESEDENVELLMVIDAWAPAYWSQGSRLRRLFMQAVYRSQRFRWTIQRLGQSDTVERRAYIRRALRGMAAAAARNLSSRLHRMHLPVEVRLTEEMRRSEQLEYIASYNYAPGPVRCPILSFRSEEQPTGPLLASDMGWSNLLGRPVTVEKLPGDHQEIFDIPGATTMAIRAREALGLPVDAYMLSGVPGKAPDQSSAVREVPFVEA